MSEAWKTWEGQAVDGFPLRQYLGGSDHSAVYLTQLNSSGAQSAAIKFIPADAAADAQLARWRVAGELTHPHLLQLVRVGRCQLANTDFLYVVMEYAEEDLSQILPQRALEPEETRQMLESVLDGLKYLHGQGLAHTRIKPANILAAGDQLKISSDTLCEIGSAPLVRPPDTIYTAPESASAPISPAADVWSLGVTVVETLTQRTPVIKSQTRAELPVPETIPPPYLEIARRSVQLDPSRRASLKEISVLLNPAVTQGREIPMALATAEPIAAVEPEKKSLASQHVSLTPHTLLPATPSRGATGKPATNKSHFAIPVLAVILVGAAILLAPKMLNRYSQLQPQAAAVEPTIVPASTNLGPPASTTSEPAAKRDAPKQDTGRARGDQGQIAPTTSSADSGAAKRSEKQIAREKTPLPTRVSSNEPTTAEPPASKSSKPAGKDSTHGAVLYQVVPDISPRARETIQGTIRVSVKVHVDAGGNVSAADLENNSSRFFGDQAVQVARRWTFTPPQVDGRKVPSEWSLRFEFSSAATKVFPTQTNP
jgi:TonB family protein